MSRQYAELNNNKTVVIYFNLSELAEFNNISRQTLADIFSKEYGPIVEPNTANIFISEIGHIESAENHNREDFYPTIGTSIFKSSMVTLKRDHSCDIMSLLLKPMKDSPYLKNFVDGINNGEYMFSPRLTHNGRYQSPFVKDDEDAVVSKWSLLAFDFVYLPRTLTGNMEVSNTLEISIPEKCEDPAALVDMVKEMFNPDEKSPSKWTTGPVPSNYRAIYDEGKVVGMIPVDYVIPMVAEQPIVGSN